MIDLLTPEQEKKVKQVKRRLESWRECLVGLSSVLLWEKPWFPPILITAVTSVFMLHWHLDPSVLTTVSIIFLVVTLADYFGPKVTSMVCSPEHWTGSKEKQYELVCQSVVDIQDFMNTRMSALWNLKETSPRTYFLVMFSSFSLLAWLGKIVNNTLLTYFFVLTVVLAPGIKHQKVLEKYAAQFFLQVSDLIRKLQAEKPKQS